MSTTSPTVTRAEAARLLGVSLETLESFIAAGDIAALLTPSGESELSRANLLDLIAAIAASSSRTLAQVIAERQSYALELSPALLIPVLTTADTIGHRPVELRSLAYHRAIALRLDAQLVVDALSRLARWADEGKIHPYWADKWAIVLEQPVATVAAEIGSDTQEARELRQSTPFAGALTEQERRRVFELVTKALAQARPSLTPTTEL